YQTTHTLGMSWSARPRSIGFMVRAGSVGLRIEGRERAPYSVIMYMEPGAGAWTGLLEGNASAQGEPVSHAYHLSVPVDDAPALGIPPTAIVRGWQEVAIEQSVARRFAIWADQMLLQDSASPWVRDEAYGWLAEMLGPALGQPKWESPSHYTRLVRLVNQLAEVDGRTPRSVVSIAEKLGVSVRTMQRAFHSVFGVGVTLYLRNRRLQRARKLLTTGQLCVRRAAFETGFHHASRFSQQYRALFGEYPSETFALGRDDPVCG
ncbi:MAG TPA: helix-turn-helix domain-containing protein, partial [Polyangiaceae bacterium]|nr:helix-turn-helix domain-containing protein [Polyangiaceae bacterium]